MSFFFPKVDANSRPVQGYYPLAAASRPDLFPAASIFEDAKDKAKRLGRDAQDEFDRASHKVQANMHEAGAEYDRTRRNVRNSLSDMGSRAETEYDRTSSKVQKELHKAGEHLKQDWNAASQKAQAAAGTIPLYSGKYYAACTMGGILACGLTHTAVTPLDLVKCRRQVNSQLYKGNFQAWSTIYKGEGFGGIMTGWGPTLLGYSVQGAFKYGFYEFFKKKYSDIVGPEAAVKYKTLLYLTASASAELIADVGLCPLEAVKVRMQTAIPSPFTGTFDGISKIVASEGVAGLYKGIVPLWGRQIPYTMMKFASFETIVEMIYRRLPGTKSDYSKLAQTGVAFTGGYLAGILCAVVSHPADVLVSKLNADRGKNETFGAAVSRTYNKIGFSGLWNGLAVRIIMVGTLTGLQWMIYDSFKIFMGLPTTGGAAPPEQKRS